MSRIDLLTIGIVIACVVALGALIYNVVNITGGEEAGAESIENVDPYDDYFDDDTDDESTASLDDENEYSADEAHDNNEEEMETAALDSEEPGEIADEELDTSEDSTPESYDASTLGNGRGQYMVMAGSFGIKSNAEKEAERLRSLGYSNAVVEPFDRGTVYVVLADRFDDISLARNAARDLKNQHGVDTYIKKSNTAKE